MDCRAAFAVTGDFVQGSCVVSGRIQKTRHDGDTFHRLMETLKAGASHKKTRTAAALWPQLFGFFLIGVARVALAGLWLSRLWTGACRGSFCCGCASRAPG
jgi:hypothetical protein